MFHLTASDISAMAERAHRHQFNDRAVRMTRTLGEPAGLTKMGVHLIRLEPGFDSTSNSQYKKPGRFVD